MAFVLIPLFGWNGIIISLHFLHYFANQTPGGVVNTTNNQLSSFCEQQNFLYLDFRSWSVMWRSDDTKIEIINYGGCYLVH